jgi:protein-S-isoprenylcysteine O-methyltransferase Ste14
MTPHDVFRLLIQVPWIVFLIYWIARAFNTRATREKEPFASRYGVLAVEIAGYLLIFGVRTRIAFLEARVFSHSFARAVVGVILTWAGIALTIWARRHLAENWSARVTIKEGHELIRTGPYAHFRHPIYSGLILATFGSALAIAKWRCVFGLCLVVAGYWFKARKEEAMLEQKFGEPFREHKRHTGFLIPRFR